MHRQRRSRPGGPAARRRRSVRTHVPAGGEVGRLGQRGCSVAEDHAPIARRPGRPGSRRATPPGARTTEEGRGRPRISSVAASMRRRWRSAVDSSLPRGAHRRPARRRAEPWPRPRAPTAQPTAPRASRPPHGAGPGLDSAVRAAHLVAVGQVGRRLDGLRVDDQGHRPGVSGAGVEQSGQASGGGHLDGGVLGQAARPRRPAGAAPSAARPWSAAGARPRCPAGPPGQEGPVEVLADRPRARSRPARLDPRDVGPGPRARPRSSTSARSTNCRDMPGASSSATSSSAPATGAQALPGAGQHLGDLVAGDQRGRRHPQHRGDIA